MSFSSTGYSIDSYTNVMNRIYNAFIKVLPDLEFTPDNIITHWQEILAYEQRLTQVMLGDAISNFSILTATGIFLEKLGIEAGVIKKGVLLASGDLLVNGECIETNSIPINSIFSTSDGRNYKSTEARTFPEEIAITRGDLQDDDVPSPYKNSTVYGLYNDVDLTSEISTGYYSITGDSIVWNTIGMVSGVSEGSLYYAGVNGNIDLIVPVVSEYAGSNYNVSADKINVNVISFVDSVTNESPFYNGKDIESDVDYRIRVLKARKKTFSLNRIESLVENLQGVRDAKTYQVTNTDRNSFTIVTGWENSLPWDLNYITGLTGLSKFVPSGEWFGFSFYPSEEIATIKEFKLYGRVSGTNVSPRVIPKLEYYLKPHYSGAYNTDTGYYLQKGSIEKYDLERDNYDGWQEITPQLKYNGINNSKSYQMYLRETGFVHVHSGHWEFLYTGLATPFDYRNQSYITGEVITDKQILYRTMHGAPAYNIDVVVEDGYRFDPEIKDKIEKILNYEEYGGNSPVCIQYDIRKAIKTYLSLSVYMFLLPNYTFADVVSDMKVNVGNYLRGVKSAESIYYTMVERAILNTDGVLKLKNMKMKLNDGDWIDRTTQDDIGLSEREYVDLDLSNLYDGISVYEG